jgi:hypothetical protein
MGEIEWSAKSNNRADALTLRFKELLRQQAVMYAESDQSEVITDANVNEASRTILRGDRKKRNCLIAFLRALLELLGGGFFGAAASMLIGIDPVNRIIVWILCIAGAVMFITAKILEHATSI